MTGTQNRYSPDDVIAIFNIILNEAAKAFKRNKKDVTEVQFGVVSGGRLGVRSMAKCGGFITLKAHVLKVKK